MAASRYHRAKAHAKRTYHAAKSHAKAGIKPVAIGLVAGAAGAMAQGYLVQNVGFFNSNWYAAPLALAAAGFLVAKKNPTAGMALAGAAGAMGYIGYVMKNQQSPQSPPKGGSFRGMDTSAYPSLDDGNSMTMDDGATTTVLAGY